MKRVASRHSPEDAGQADRAAPERTRGRRLDPIIFLAVVAAAFAIRLIHLYQARSVVFFDILISDGRAYDAWAQRIAAGNWLGTEVFYQAPLYPYFLALVQLLVGHDLWWIRVVQVAVGAVSCGLLFLAGRSFFSRGVGIAAGAMLALYPPAIYFDALIQKTGFGLLWTTLLLWLLGRSQERPGLRRWVLVGVVAGLLILTRENALLLVPVVVVWIALRFADHRKTTRLSWTAAFALGLAVALLPVGVRNLAVGGQFALTTAQAGPNFYIGNNPKANGSYSPLRPGRSDTPQERQDATDLAEEALGRPLTPREVSHYWLGRAWAYIHEQPLDWLRLMAFKCLLVVDSYEISDAEDLYFYEQHCSLLRGLGVVGHFGVLVPLAAAGIVLTWPRRRELWLLYVLLVTIAVGVAVFFVFARYRFPMVPILVLFAAAAVVRGYAAIRGRRVRALAVAVLAAAATAVPVNWPIYSRDEQLGLSYTNAGAALAYRGRFDEAIEQYRIALEHRRDAAETHFDLAYALRQTGRLDEAVEHLRTAAKLSPQDPEIQYQLGNTLAERGELRAAAEHFRRALDLRPDYVEARQNLGVALLRGKQWGAGIEALRRGLDEAPNRADLAGILAWVLATCPEPSLRDPDAAVRLAERACRLTRWEDPGHLDTLATAYAAAGRFDEAVTTARRALHRAEETGADDLSREIRARLRRFEAGQPAHDAP